MGRSFLLVVISALLSPCLARITTVSVEEKGLSTVLIADSFGMAAGGYINFDVTASEKGRNRYEYNITRCVQHKTISCFLVHARFGCAYLVVRRPSLQDFTKDVVRGERAGRARLHRIPRKTIFKHGAKQPAAYHTRDGS